MDWKEQIAKLSKIEVGFDVPNLIRSFEVYLRLRALDCRIPYQEQSWSSYRTLVNHWEVGDEDIISFFTEKGYNTLALDEIYGPWGIEDSISSSFIFVTEDKLQHVFRKLEEGGESDKIKIRTLGLGPEATEERYHFLETFSEHQVQNKPQSRSVHVIVPRSHGSGYEFTWAGVSGHPLDPNLYMPDHVEGFLRIQEALTQPLPEGRLVLLSGPPGTGKTYFLRGLIEAVEGFFVLIPSSMVENIGDPTLMQAFLQHKSDSGSSTEPLILLIEDADRCLVSRAADNMAALSNLLNMCDGILGDALDLRVVATTNAKRVDVDAAITREGRLHTSLRFDQLDQDKANEIYVHLTGTEPEAPLSEKLTLAEVFSIARPHIPPKPKKTNLPDDLPDTPRARYAKRMEGWMDKLQTDYLKRNARMRSIVFDPTMGIPIQHVRGAKKIPRKFRFHGPKRQKPGF